MMFKLNMLFGSDLQKDADVVIEDTRTRQLLRDDRRKMAIGKKSNGLGWPQSITMAALNIATLARMYSHPKEARNQCLNVADANVHFEVVTGSIITLHDLNIDPRKVTLYAWDVDKNETARFGYMFDVPTYMHFLKMSPEEQVERRAHVVACCNRSQMPPSLKCIALISMYPPVMIVMCPTSAIEWAAEHLNIAVDAFPREVYAMVAKMYLRNAASLPTKPSFDKPFIQFTLHTLLQLHSALVVPHLYPDECACHVCSRGGSSCCSNCLDVRYCSDECQNADWEQHKHKCRKMGIDNCGSGGGLVTTGIHRRTVALGGIDVSIYKHGKAPAWLECEKTVGASTVAYV